MLNRNQNGQLCEKRRSRKPPVYSYNERIIGYIYRSTLRRYDVPTVPMYIYIYMYIL